MKKTFLTLAFAILCLSQQVKAEPVMIDIITQENANIRAFLLAADGEAIKYSVDQSGTASTTMPMSRIKQLQVFVPDEWVEAESNYKNGDYEKAEEQFRKLAEELSPIAALEDEIGALSKFYYLKCLKANGKFELLNEEINKMRTQPFALSARYNSEAAWLVPWGMMGAKNWDGLLQFVANYYDTDGQKDNPIPPFKTTVPRSKLAELSYFRGIATRQKLQDETDPVALKDGMKKATDDFYRAITLNRGADRQITKEAMLALLQITSKELADSPANTLLKSELYTLAHFYQQAFGEGSLPSEYTRFLTPPPAPAG